MALVTARDLHAPLPSNGAKRVFERVVERAASDAAPMPPPPNARLAPEDSAVLAAWAAAGAPLESTACGAGGATDDAAAPEPLACLEKLTLRPGARYEMPADTPDAYVCYGFDAPGAGDRHAVELGPLVDNARIVHHMILFQSPTSVPSAPAPCSAAGSRDWRIVDAWAPGAGAMKLPSDVGFPLASGGSNHYVVQLHYNNAQARAGETDASGFEVCTSEPRLHEADVMAFGTQDISIPPGAELTRRCRVELPFLAPTIHVFAAFPHMHGVGTAIRSEALLAGGGAAVSLGVADPFSFDAQAWLPVNATLAAGDTVVTSCTWKNTRPAAVAFGERTEDEMCYSFSMYYPRIAIPQWTWLAPALGSTCE